MHITTPIMLYNTDTQRPSITLNNVNTTHEPVRLVNFDKHLDITIEVGKTYNAKLGDRIVPLTILGKEQEEGRLATDIWFISPELNEAASISSKTTITFIPAIHWISHSLNNKLHLIW